MQSQSSIASNQRPSVTKETSIRTEPETSPDKLSTKKQPNNKSAEKKEIEKRESQSSSSSAKTSSSLKQTDKKESETPTKSLKQTSNNDRSDDVVKTKTKSVDFADPSPPKDTISKPLNGSTKSPEQRKSSGKSQIDSITVAHSSY